jgi:outer membrane protein OmpA-like peptidoglycan-associated protein
MMYRSLLTAAAVAVVVAPAGGAQDRPTRAGSWEFSVGGGAMLVDRGLMDFLSSGSPESRFTKTADVKELAPVAILRLGYNLGNHFGVNLSGEVAEAEGVRYYTPGLSLVYTVNQDARTTPFLLFGSEITRVEGQNDRVTHSTWGATAGLGLRSMLTDHMALRLEARAKYADYDEVPMEKRGTIAPLATIGLTWYTNGRRTPQAAIQPMRPMPMTAMRVDTVRSVRVDTLRSVRVDTVSSAMDQVVLRVQFRTDAAELLPISYPVLNTVATAIKATPNSRWMVEGHTDSVGTAEYNQTLSQARAQTVLDYLVSQGVSRSVLTAQGFGSARPVFSNSTVEGRAENRRVQLRRIPPAPTAPVR